jgi:hypothetical protein
MPSCASDARACYSRLTLKPKRPGWSANRSFSIVDLPDPDGPDITIGCRDVGRLINDSASDIFAIVDIVELERVCNVANRLLMWTVVYAPEFGCEVARRTIVEKLLPVEVIFECTTVDALPTTIDSRACTRK